MLSDHDFEIYKSLIADVERAKANAGDVQVMSNLFPGNKKVLEELMQANQALVDFHVERSEGFF